MRIIVLAAGEGKRMGGGDLPKVLVPLRGRPIVSYLLDAILASGVDSRPSIVIGKHAELVRESLGSGFDYVLQDRQLGTGHAVMAARELLEGSTEHIMVLYGDHILLSPHTIQRLAETHIREGNTLTLATSLVPDFDDWRRGFYEFGRIIRSADGKLERIVEKKDASPDELVVREINPAYFCFNAAWLWRSLLALKNDNAQGEYYLTDLLALAVKKQEKIGSIAIEPKEALGVNTREQLALVESFV